MISKIIVILFFLKILQCLTQEVEITLKNNLNATLEIQWPDPAGSIYDIAVLSVIKPLGSSVLTTYVGHVFHIVDTDDPFIVVSLVKVSKKKSIYKIGEKKSK